MVRAVGVHSIQRPWPPKQQPTDRTRDCQQEDEEQLAERDEEGDADQHHERDHNDGNHEHGDRFTDVGGATRVGQIGQV